MGVLGYLNSSPKSNASPDKPRDIKSVEKSVVKSVTPPFYNQNVKVFKTLNPIPTK